ncbi:transporter [Polaribacter reichenbachii]|uniref:Transporter n=1 Tax=Polaribacter reichenbachii TaxID=996801 RepID=A0A1B8TWF5_9FLAO|nr:TolC family protein [Polaribacter reichenbachii]APZ48065.1 transporter [Polaribacter reichenbachii]AUC20540.1 transporter [Polaribacter reichenbachii]OBY63983.1 transporter [Polaribacter reichenbachii]
MKKTILVFLSTCFFLITNAQEKTIKLSLKEAIDFAIENSYNTKAAANDIKVAKETVWETTTIGLPQINGAVDYQKYLKLPITLLDFDNDGVNEEFVFVQKQNVNATVTLSQLLFDGSYLVGLQASKTYLKISKQAKEKTELVTREAIINAYGNVLVAEKSIDILKRNNVVNNRILKEAKAGYENGLSEQEDVEQFEIIKGNIENNIRATERLRDIAYKLLNISLGNPIETKLILTDSLESLVLANTNLNLLVEEFKLNNHIDFKIAENDRETKRLTMQLEKSKSLPSLSAFINYGTQAFSEEFSFFKGEQRWFQSSLLGVSLNVPIFSSFGRKAKIAQTKINLETADIRLEETKQRLSLAAQSAKSNYQLSIDNYETAKKNLNLAERIEKKQQIKFDEGITTSFDLLQAQNQLYTQQNNYVQAMLNIIATKATLENALNLPIK